MPFRQISTEMETTDPGRFRQPAGHARPANTREARRQTLFVQLDWLRKKVITFVSIAIEIGAIEISSSRGVLESQGASRREWAPFVSQLPLFCNTRIAGIRADGAQFRSGPTRGCVRLLFAFYTGSSDLGFNTNSILRRQITVFCCFLSYSRVTRQKGAI